MLKIIATPQIQGLIETAKEIKRQQQLLNEQLKIAQQNLLNEPVVAQSLYNEMNTVNEKGTSLTGTVEIYDREGDQLLSISKVGWDMKISQSLARKYLIEHPEASVFLEEQVKPKTRPLLEAAKHDESLVENLGIVYTESTPYVKLG
jgi:response regulator of citrate/malate metabolism